jgi:ribonuclease PH
MVDCDVLQADGGTRAASITGACIALEQAQQRWLRLGMIEKPFLKDMVAAISVGVMKGEPLLDLNFDEDSIIDGDFNFVLTKSGNIVEVQGTAEHTLISWAQFDELKKLAINAIADIFTLVGQSSEPKEKKSVKAPLFSLQNRLQKSSVTDESQ